MELSLALAFAAGIASFVTPCVLALVPVYLAVLADAAVGVPSTAAAPAAATPTVALSTGAPSAGATVSGGTTARPMLAQAGLFTLGFGIVFVMLGISVGLLGMALFREPLVRQLAGVVVIGLGLLMTGLFGPVLDRLPNPAAALPPTTARGTRSLGLGAVVAIGWTPCIGPVLGAILAMGASTQDVGAATLLLVAYSIGLAVPFLLTAAFLPRLTPILRWLREHERPIRIASGLSVAAIGVLIVLDAFTRLAGLFGEFFL